MEEEIPTSAKNAKLVAIMSSFLIAMFLLIGVVWYFFTPFIQQESSGVSIPPKKSIVTPSLFLTESPTISQVTDSKGEIFTSAKMGIRFRFSREQAGGDEQINISEEGNKIYVYPTSLSPNQGQFIEQFSKSPEQSLENAIRTQLLTNKDPNRCLISTQNTGSIVRAEITFPSSNRESMDTFFADSDYCSKDYAQTNGLRYFMYNPSHPEKYFFISIGQYPITADKDTPWQETIEVIN